MKIKSMLNINYNTVFALYKLYVLFYDLFLSVKTESAESSPLRAFMAIP